jgi:glutamate racemase
LHKPIAVFDAGIGSYAAVALLRERLPHQDILYLADRASFPYGAKERPALLAILRRTLAFLGTFDPAAVLVASNAPSITVLDDLVVGAARPVFGVRPPVKEALAAAGARDVAILGVTSLVESPELRAYVAAQAGDDARRVKVIDASSLVDLVESGQFLADPKDTQARVARYIERMNARYPDLGCLTLSSTHLPWLRTFMEPCCFGQHLLDPLGGVVEEIAGLATQGTGQIVSLVTTSAAYGIADFRLMLRRLGLDLALHEVRF